MRITLLVLCMTAFGCGFFDNDSDKTDERSPEQSDDDQVAAFNLIEDEATDPKAKRVSYFDAEDNKQSETIKEYDDQQHLTLERAFSRNSAGRLKLTSVTKYEYNDDHQLTRKEVKSFDAQGEVQTAVETTLRYSGGKNLVGEEERTLKGGKDLTKKVATTYPDREFRDSPIFSERITSDKDGKEIARESNEISESGLSTKFECLVGGKVIYRTTYNAEKREERTVTFYGTTSCGPDGANVAPPEPEANATQDGENNNTPEAEKKENEQEVSVVQYLDDFKQIEELRETKQGASEIRKRCKLSDEEKAELTCELEEKQKEGGKLLRSSTSTEVLVRVKRLLRSGKRQSFTISLAKTGEEKTFKDDDAGKEKVTKTETEFNDLWRTTSQVSETTYDDFWDKSSTVYEYDGRAPLKIEYKDASDTVYGRYVYEY